MDDIKTIRKAILQNRGGWEDAGDEQLKYIWDSLSEETQAAYLETIATEEEKGSATESTEDTEKKKKAKSK